MKISVLIVDDEVKLRKLLSRIIALEGYAVTEAGSLAEARERLRSGAVDLILCDVRLPDGNGVDFTRELLRQQPQLKVILLTAFGTIADAVQATRNGALDYLVKGDDNDRIIPLLSQAADAIRAARELIRGKPAAQDSGFERISGESPAIRQAVALAKRVAPTDASVLLTGETGTGKEVFARAIHAASNRSERPYVAVNCSSFSRELLESTLFGHKAGSFTDASRDKKGLMEEADGGTLFMDELGELPAELQPKLLRVLEDGSYYALGDTRLRKTNVRIVAATNRDLRDAIATGGFRSDLYYRIAVFHIALPALRERPEDIGALATQFLRDFAGRMNKDISGFDADALALLRRHRWEGNIRELKNAVERSIILEDGSRISVDSLPMEVRNADDSLPAFDLAAMEKVYIHKALAATGNNKAEAARLLNIGIATLYRKLAETSAREK